jgi:hypothetical protein
MDPLAISTAIVTFGKLVSDLVKLKGTFSEVPSTLTSLDADCRSMISTMASAVVLLFGRRQRSQLQLLTGPAFDMGNELTRCVLNVHPAIEQLREKIKSLMSPPGDGLRVRIKQVQGLLVLRKIEDVHQDLRRQMDAFNRIRDNLHTYGTERSSSSVCKEIELPVM